MKSFSLSIFVILLIHINAIAQSDVTTAYIEQYRHIAIGEMERVQIPASIKMAQAILESNSGRSTLSRQSNNHFGIKCGKSWTGREVYHEDDDYDQDGLLTRSCFRAFDDPAESFYEHSAFLANPYSKRYKFLFDLDIYDYKAWARGLKKAGYATDPKYPSKLINLIEKYRLYELDLNIIPIDDYQQELADVTVEPASVEDTTEPTPRNKSISKLPARSRNGVYRVRLGDTMASIARKHGLQTKSLYLKNRIPFNHEPLVGEEVKIEGYVHFSKRPKSAPTDQSDDVLFEETIIISKSR